jgi:hypothetical protein
MTRFVIPALVMLALVVGVILGGSLSANVMHSAQVKIGGDALLAGGTFVMAGLMLTFLWGQGREIAELRERVAKLEGKDS